MAYDVISANEILFVHTGSVINVRNNPVASESAVTQLSAYDKLFFNYSGQNADGTYTQIKVHDDASNLDFIYCNVFTKDGFFRNVWVAVKNTVTGTIYLTTQPFFNYANQSMNDAKQHGTYLPYQIDDDGFTPYYQTNFYDYNGYLAVKLKKDAPVYDASGVQVGVLHGSTNVYDKPVLVYGDVNNFATGKTLKDVVSFRSVVVYDKDNGFVNSYTGDHYTGTQPAGNIAYVKTDALAKGLTGA